MLKFAKQNAQFSATKCSILHYKMFKSGNSDATYKNENVGNTHFKRLHQTQHFDTTSAVIDVKSLRNTREGTEWIRRDRSRHGARRFLWKLRKRRRLRWLCRSRGRRRHSQPREPRGWLSQRWHGSGRSSSPQSYIPLS